jgi:hypothetical protein
MMFGLSRASVWFDEEGGGTENCRFARSQAFIFRFLFKAPEGSRVVSCDVSIKEEQVTSGRYIMVEYVVTEGRGEDALTSQLVHYLAGFIVFGNGRH